MGLLGMSHIEHDYQEQMVRESFHLLGETVNLYEVKVIERDYNEDPLLEYSESYKKVDIMFADYPKPTYKDDMWQKEYDKSQQPWKVYIPTRDINGSRIDMQKYVKLELVTRMDKKLDEDQLNTFLVTNVQGTKLNPFVWICNIVPYRHKLDIVPDTPEYNKYKSEVKKDDDINVLNMNKEFKW